MNRSIPCSDVALSRLSTSTRRMASRGPEESLGQSQTHDGLLRALMTLRTEYRAVIVLRHFTGCSYEDVERDPRRAGKDSQIKALQRATATEDALLERRAGQEGVAR